MAITKLSDSSITTGDKYISMLAGNSAYMPSSFESIASATSTGTETEFTFSSIPQTYASLQLRCILRRNTTGTANMGLRPNNESSTSFYTRHILSGTGGAPTAGGTVSGTYTYAINNIEVPGTSTGAYCVQIWDIHNYASTTQNKTLRTFSGLNKNGSGEVALGSNLFISTNAITSLVVYFGGDITDAGSTFALYGIKAA